MSDLIDRQAAIEAVSQFFDKAYIEDADIHKNDALYELSLVPSVQPDWGKPVGDGRPLADGEVIARLQDIKKQIDAIERTIEVLKWLSSAQPEIIACGDCIHWICHDRRCGYWNHGSKPLDWCCHAERRTDE